MPKTLKAHSFADLLPMMSEPEYAALKLDIETVRQRDDIILFEGKILDGRNRYRAVTELRHEPKTREFKGNRQQALAYVLSKTQHRHMSESQRACVAVQFGEQMSHQNSDGGPDTYINIDTLSARFAVNRDHISKARTLREKAPKLFDEVFNDRLPVHRAFAEHRRRAKKKALNKLAKDLGVNGGGDWSIADGDMVEVLNSRTLSKSFDRARLVFIDPPYNIGIDYGNGAKADSMPRLQFEKLSFDWLEAAAAQLTDDGSLFVMTSLDYLAAYETILLELGLHRRQTIIWVETFGTYTAGNFSPCCRPILYFTKHPKNFVWHGDQILIPSDRQKKYGDSRANPAGKVPSNVWDDIPRLVGNDGDRVPGFPTQIPREITDRIVLVASDPGDLVIDGFNGSGTTGVSAVTAGRRYLGVEKVPANAVAARARIASALATMNQEGT